MASRVLNLDELASRIATHLLAISPRSVVALALTCRAVEVPALRALWGSQSSLSSLFKRVVMRDARCYIRSRHFDIMLFALEPPITVWELSRLKRYASWMRQLEVREWKLSEELTRLVLPPSDGSPPALPLHVRELDWWLNETNLSFVPNFLSPHLTSLVITTDGFSNPIDTVEPWDELPDEAVPVIRSAIKAFPSSPQIICIKLGCGPETRLMEEISAYILRCGDALQEFATNVVLSTQAIVHLMKLSNLRSWTTEQGPPQVTDLIHHGIPDAVVSLFPSLDHLDLRSKEAFEWLSLFEATNGRSPPWIMAGNSLPNISYHHPSVPIDSPLVSRFPPFTDLVELRLMHECMYQGPCVSRFTDEDVECLAIALPKLEVLTLGERPCDSDTCPTTIRSLLFLSIHCPKLRYVNLHFRTTNLRADMLNLLGDAYSQGLHLKPKCILRTLVTRNMPLKLSDYDPVLISMGLRMMFPLLDKFFTNSTEWLWLEFVVKAWGPDEDSVAVLTERLMENLVRVREWYNEEVYIRLADEIARDLCGPLWKVLSKYRLDDRWKLGW